MPVVNNIVFFTFSAVKIVAAVYVKCHAYVI